MSYNPPGLSLTEDEEDSLLFDIVVGVVVVVVVDLLMDDVSSLRLRPRKHVSAIRISVFNVLVVSCPILATWNKLLLDDERNVSMSKRNSVTSDCGIKLGIMTYPLVDKDSMFDGDNDKDDDDNSIFGGDVEGPSIVVVIVLVVGW
jgi:hypothetical protein